MIEASFRADFQNAKLLILTGMLLLLLFDVAANGNVGSLPMLPLVGSADDWPVNGAAAADDEVVSVAFFDRLFGNGESMWNLERVRLAIQFFCSGNDSSSLLSSTDKSTVLTADGVFRLSLFAFALEFDDVAVPWDKIFTFDELLGFAADATSLLPAAVFLCCCLPTFNLRYDGDEIVAVDDVLSPIFGLIFSFLLSFVLAVVDVVAAADDSAAAIAVVVVVVVVAAVALRLDFLLRLELYSLWVRLPPNCALVPTCALFCPLLLPPPTLPKLLCAAECPSVTAESNCLRDSAIDDFSTSTFLHQTCPTLIECVRFRGTQCITEFVIPLFCTVALSLSFSLWLLPIESYPIITYK